MCKAGKWPSHPPDGMGHSATTSYVVTQLGRKLATRVKADNFLGAAQPVCDVMSRATSCCAGAFLDHPDASLYLRLRVAAVKPVVQPPVLPPPESPGQFSNWCKVVLALNQTDHALRLVCHSTVGALYHAVRDVVAAAGVDPTLQCSAESCVPYRAFKAGVEATSETPPCDLCRAWLQAWLAHHRLASGDRKHYAPGYQNVATQRLPEDPWQGALLFMPTGNQGATDANSTDSSGLLNLVAHCTAFGSVPSVEPVRRVRNEAFHSKDRCFTVPAMRDHMDTLLQLLEELDGVCPSPDIKAAMAEVGRLRTLGAKVSPQEEDAAMASSKDVLLADIRRLELSMSKDSKAHRDELAALKDANAAHAQQLHRTMTVVLKRLDSNSSILQHMDSNLSVGAASGVSSVAGAASGGAGAEGPTNKEFFQFATSNGPYYPSTQHHDLVQRVVAASKLPFLPVYLYGIGGTGKTSLARGAMASPELEAAYGGAMFEVGISGFGERGEEDTTEQVELRAYDVCVAFLRRLRAAADMPVVGDVKFGSEWREQSLGVVQDALIQVGNVRVLLDDIADGDQVRVVLELLRDAAVALVGAGRVVVFMTSRTERPWQALNSLRAVWTVDVAVPGIKLPVDKLDAATCGTLVRSMLNATIDDRSERPGVLSDASVEQLVEASGCMALPLTQLLRAVHRYHTNAGGGGRNHTLDTSVAAMLGQMEVGGGGAEWWRCLTTGLDTDAGSDACVVLSLLATWRQLSALEKFVAMAASVWDSHFCAKHLVAAVVAVLERPRGWTLEDEPPVAVKDQGLASAEDGTKLELTTDPKKAAFLQHVGSFGLPLGEAIARAELATKRVEALEEALHAKLRLQALSVEYQPLVGGKRDAVKYEGATAAESEVLAAVNELIYAGWLQHLKFEAHGLDAERFKNHLPRMNQHDVVRAVCRSLLRWVATPEDDTLTTGSTLEDCEVDSSLDVERAMLFAVVAKYNALWHDSMTNSDGTALLTQAECEAHVGVLAALRRDTPEADALTHIQLLLRAGEVLFIRNEYRRARDALEQGYAMLGAHPELADQRAALWLRYWRAMCHVKHQVRADDAPAGGKWDERAVEREFRAIIAQQTISLPRGAHHPDTLGVGHALAYTLMDAGRLEEALVAWELVIDGRTKALGADHPDTLRARRNRGDAYIRIGKLNEAREELAEVLELQKRKLRANHGSVMVTMHRLASLEDKLGRPEKAVELFDEAVAAFASDVGKNHAEALDCRAARADTLIKAKRPAEALKDLLEIHEVYLELHGAKHSRTLDVEQSMRVAKEKLLLDGHVVDPADV